MSKCVKLHLGARRREVATRKEIRKKMPIDKNSQNLLDDTIVGTLARTIVVFVCTSLRREFRALLLRAVGAARYRSEMASAVLMTATLHRERERERERGQR